MVRDKAVIGGMLAEVAGKKAADANIAATDKAKKAIIRDCLAGENGREKVTGWLPPWFKFPMAVCDRADGIRSLHRARRAAAAAKKARKA